LQPLILDGVEDDTCPRRPMMDPEASRAYGDLFRFASAYERGIPPEDGGIQSQPHRLMQLIQWTLVYRSECMEEQRKSQTTVL
jgi:hypothetical protein